MGARKTLLDLAVGLDPQGRTAKVYEVLTEKAPILNDAVAFPSNAPMGNLVTVRTGLPAIRKVRINQGIAASKSTKTQRTDSIGTYGGRSELDKKLMHMHGSDIVNAERWNEDRAFIEAMAQALTRDIFYGDENIETAGMTGLAPRMNALGSLIRNSQVYSMGSVSGGDGTSIYVVDWGQDGAHLIYPRDRDQGGSGADELTKLGMRVEPLAGDVEVRDADGNPFRALITEYYCYLGLTIKDPRRVARLANIDTSDANLVSPTQGTLHDRVIDLLEGMPPADGFNRVMYVTRSIKAGWTKQSMNKSNVWLSMGEYNGKLNLMFQGIPVRAVDAISSAESTVS